MLATESEENASRGIKPRRLRCGHLRGADGGLEEHFAVTPAEDATCDTSWRTATHSAWRYGESWMEESNVLLVLRIPPHLKTTAVVFRPSAVRDQTQGMMTRLQICVGPDSFRQLVGHEDERSHQPRVVTTDERMHSVILGKEREDQQ